MKQKSLENVTSYKKHENLKNEDPPTRKPHFWDVTGTKNQPQIVQNRIFIVLKSIMRTGSLKEASKGGVRRKSWQQLANK